MGQQVLLGLAGSDESLRALESTVDRAVEAGDDLTVAIVERDDTEYGPAALRERVEEAAAEAGIEVDVRVLEGDPGGELVAFAERESFDRLVIGGGTESPMGKIQLGPVAEYVLLNAQITVTLVR